MLSDAGINWRECRMCFRDDTGINWKDIDVMSRCRGELGEY